MGRFKKNNISIIILKFPQNVRRVCTAIIKMKPLVPANVQSLFTRAHFAIVNMMAL